MGTLSVYFWVADWNLSRAEAVQLLGGHAVDMVDATDSNFAHLLATYPAVKHFAGYVTGGGGIEWTEQHWQEIPKDCTVWHIDQSNSETVWSAVRALVKDVERGASSDPVAARVAAARHTRGLDTVIYCSRATLPTVEAALAHVGLTGTIIAYQYASPVSNPNTAVPGGHKSLFEIDCDLSVVKALPAVTPVTKRHVGILPIRRKPKPVKYSATVTIDDTGHWSIHAS